MSTATMTREDEARANPHIKFETKPEREARFDAEQKKIEVDRDAAMERDRESSRRAQPLATFNSIMHEAGTLFAKRAKLVSAINYQPDPAHLKSTVHAFLGGGPWTQSGGLSDIVNRRHLAECCKVVLPEVETEIEGVIQRLATCARSYNLNIAVRVEAARNSIRPDFASSIPSDLASRIQAAEAKLPR